MHCDSTEETRRPDEAPWLNREKTSWADWIINNSKTTHVFESFCGSCTESEQMTVNPRCQHHRQSSRMALSPGKARVFLTRWMKKGEVLRSGSRQPADRIAGVCGALFYPRVQERGQWLLLTVWGGPVGSVTMVTTEITTVIIFIFVTYAYVPDRVTLKQTFEYSQHVWFIIF